MPSSVLQFNTVDTTPQNFGNIGTDGVGSYFPLPFKTATAAGSTIVVFAGKNPGPSTLLGTASDPTNGSYGAAVESQPAISGGNASWKSWVFQNAAPIPPGDTGLATNTSNVSLTDSTKTWITNQWTGAILIDLSSDRTYTITSNTATVLTFASGIAPVNPCFYVVGSFIRIDTSAGLAFGDYDAGAVFEIGGAPVTGGIAHSSGLTTTGGAGASNISTGTAACGSIPGTMVAISLNALGNSSPFAPAADTGSGFTDLGTFFTDDNLQPTARLESKHFGSSPGTAGATFGASGADQFGSFMVFVQDGTVPAAVGAPYSIESADYF